MTNITVLNGFNDEEDVPQVQKVYILMRSVILCCIIVLLEVVEGLALHEVADHLVIQTPVNIGKSIRLLYFLIVTAYYISSYNT